eukprot:TRINITY_DN5762_c1_g2_i2.p1 TRINITY_DN5762_c1_g2~~TRINITY_DN5762_c1_g2_i2.p1  ORF type:complete len:624 (+),score=159.10 TRINITY_DN5762_c1_g2_i2:87-1958(+)
MMQSFAHPAGGGPSPVTPAEHGGSADGESGAREDCGAGRDKCSANSASKRQAAAAAGGGAAHSDPGARGPGSEAADAEAGGRRKSGAAELLSSLHNDAGYVDATLLLPVDPDIMRISIGRVYRSSDAAVPYWVYVVCVRTSLPQYLQRPPRGAETQGLTVSFERHVRYSQWEWLRGVLAAEMPGCVIPPVPGKEATSAADKVALMFTGGDEGAEEEPPPVVHFRRRALEYFLSYLAAHPALRQSTRLQDWLLCSDESDFAKLRERAAEDAKPRTVSWAERSQRLQRITRGWFRGRSAGATPGTTPSTTPQQPSLNASVASLDASRTSVAQDIVTGDTELHACMSWAHVRLHAVRTLLHQAEAFYLNRLESGSLLAAFASAADHMPLERGQLRVGMRVRHKSCGRGTIRWVGQLPRSVKPEAVWAGVEWVDPTRGKCDGTIYGERHFTCADTGGSFCLPECLQVAGCADEATDSLDIAASCTERALAELDHDQERRLFHVVSDLRLLIGWMEALHGVAAGFVHRGKEAAVIEADLAGLRQTKRDSVELELQLEEQVERLRRRTIAERATFSVEAARVKQTAAGLWRSTLHNYGQFFGNVEHHRTAYEGILMGAEKLATAWDTGG